MARTVAPPVRWRTAGSRHARDPVKSRPDGHTALRRVRRPQRTPGSSVRTTRPADGLFPLGTEMLRGLP
ncbi:hypothetical protein FM125_04290 [Micrococcus lylae]|uniref:Uncharacterized protein n=1 Tax=Micrococcus lylae TaxID=1273 RepID=A0A1R4IST6_9MICC|nr:hypothetical protein FM125_04290 [Micrococcus lylae]